MFLKNIYSDFYSLCVALRVVSEGSVSSDNFGQVSRIKETLYVVCATRKHGKHCYINLNYSNLHVHYGCIASSELSTSMY